MRYAIILENTDTEIPVFESDDIVRCFRWIRIQIKRRPEIQKDAYTVLDRDLEGLARETFL